MVEEYIPIPDHLMVMLTELRAAYDSFLGQQGKAKLRAVSYEGTLTGCLTEVGKKGGGAAGEGVILEKYIYHSTNV